MNSILLAVFELQEICLQKKKFTIIALWWLFVLWLVVAVVLSSQNGTETASTSHQVSQFIIQLFHMPETKLDIFDAFLRKLAHMVVFLLLGGLLYIALYETLETKKYIWLWVGISCSTFAIFDEVKKSFIAGRHCQWDEAGLNLFGVLASVVLLKFGIWAIKEVKKLLPCEKI
jgi:VanZ family protein